MSKKTEVARATEASSDAAQAAKLVIQHGFNHLIGEELELPASKEETPKYTIIKGIEMQQFSGAMVKTNGILDETGTVVACSIARPGNTKYAVRTGNNLTRTIMFGDVSVFAFNKAEMKVGMRIMPTKSWMIMQSKDSSGVERIPFIRTPWDVRQSITSQTGNLQAPSLDRKIKSLCDLVINLSSAECYERIRHNEPSQVQQNYGVALAGASQMAEIISSRRVEVASSAVVTNSEPLPPASAKLFD